MSMSLSQFRKHLFQSFALMRDTKATFDVHHRRKVYKIHVEETGEKVKTPYKRKSPKNIIAPSMISSEVCDKCGSLLVASLCMNKECDTNKKAT